MKTFSTFALCAGLCAAIPAFAGPVRYSFTATTAASVDSPAHTQKFDLFLPDFVSVAGGQLIPFQSDDPALQVCEPCAPPPSNALYFLRSGSGDLLQFIDANGTNSLYNFEAGAFSTIGSWNTLIGINVPRGTLTVAAVPEPSTAGLALCGAAALAIGRRRLRALRA